MTIRDWLKTATQTLEQAVIPSASIDSTLILAHALGQDRTYLIAHPDEPLTDSILSVANGYLVRRKKYEPMAFILGYKEFFSLKLKTDQRALIPRGETECLVQAALDWLNKQDTPQRAAEIGTGSGAISVALAHSAPQHEYYATDISLEALALAKKNAADHNVAITFLPGNLGEPLSHLAGAINLLTANLPYIPEYRLSTLDSTITYFEPNVALAGGANGLELYHQFFPQAKELLAPGGVLLCEHDDDQGEAMRDLAHTHFPNAAITTLQDYSGHDRVLSCLAL